MKSRFEYDVQEIKEELLEVGQRASKLMSLATKKHGMNAPEVEVFDDVAQKVTVALLSLEYNMTTLFNEEELPDPGGSNLLPVPPIETFRPANG